MKDLEGRASSSQALSYPDTDEIDFHRFFLWFRYREDLENEVRRDDSNYRDSELEAVRRAVESVIPGYSNFRVRRNPDRFTLLKKIGDTQTEFNIHQMSDGEKGLIALVGDIARRLAIANPDVEEPLLGVGVILIDEVELHLHPAWQRQIVPVLVRTFPNCQFFFSTHSPQVLSELEDADVFVLQTSPDADKGIQATKLDKLYGRDSNRILEDVMGVPERPLPIKEDLQELFRIIDSGDLKAARKKREELGKLLYSEEPEFAAADVLMHRLEMRAK